MSCTLSGIGCLAMIPAYGCINPWQRGPIIMSVCRVKSGMLASLYSIPTFLLLRPWASSYLGLGPLILYVTCGLSELLNNEVP